MTRKIALRLVLKIARKYLWDKSQEDSDRKYWKAIDLLEEDL